MQLVEKIGIWNHYISLYSTVESIFFKTKNKKNVPENSVLFPE